MCNIVTAVEGKREYRAVSAQCRVQNYFPIPSLILHFQTDRRNISTFNIFFFFCFVNQKEMQQQSINFT